MKIAKLTLDGYFNYGNVLQSYALQEALKQCGHDVETIWHTPAHRLDVFARMGWRDYLKCLLNFQHYRDNLNSGRSFYESARVMKIYEFCCRHIQIRYDIRELSDIADEYDYFIIGSDQVWHPASLDEPSAQFLTFAPLAKRLSYAASVGTDRFSKRPNASYISGLNGMAHISVRGKREAELLRPYTNKPICVHCDPTFLLDASQWRALSEPPWWMKNRKYILLYFLGETPKEAAQYCKSSGLDVIRLMAPAYPNQYFISPGEWLYLIDHAERVLTDSFHGACFSILFHKDFFVLDRIETGEFQHMRGRLLDLLDSFSITSHAKPYQDSSALKPPHEEIERKIQQFRNEGFLFLKRVILDS